MKNKILELSSDVEYWKSKLEKVIDFFKERIKEKQERYNKVANDLYVNDKIEYYHKMYNKKIKTKMMTLNCKIYVKTIIISNFSVLYHYKRSDKMILNKNNMIPIVGNTYALDLSKLKSYCISVSGSYPKDKSFDNMEDTAIEHVDNEYGITITNPDSPNEVKEVSSRFQYEFYPKKNSINLPVYTVVKYIGNGIFIDLITNKSITMFDVFGVTSDTYYEKSGMDLSDLEAIEERDVLCPESRGEFEYLYRSFFQNPLAISDYFEGLETIDIDNLNNIMNLDINQVMQIENTIIEEARILLEKQYNLIPEMDQAIAIEEDKFREENRITR